MSRPVDIEDIEIIEEVVGGYDWLGTGSSYDHAGKREAEQAWSRIRSALTAAPSPAAGQEPVAVKADERVIRDAIRSAYDCGYNDARNAYNTERDNAKGYRGREKSEELGSDVLARLGRLSTSQGDPAPEIAALRVENERLRETAAERDLLQEILDGRPAINSGLPDTYIQWSRAIYAGDVIRAAVAPEQEDSPQ